mgnify:CR=1 FL=1
MTTVEALPGLGMKLDGRPLIQQLPPPTAVRERLGDALREVRLLRALLKLCDRAEDWRELDRQLGMPLPRSCRSLSRWSEMFMSSG